MKALGFAALVVALGALGCEDKPKPAPAPTAAATP